MLNILFKNDFFVIVDKPPLVLSVPSRLGKNDERKAIGIILQEELKTQIYPVHRLDFEVSGLLVFALTKKAQSEASLWFEKGLIKKTYEAYSLGPLPHFKKECWKSLLVRGKKRTFEAPYGKDSLTEVEFITQKQKGLLLFGLSPITGRSHQLRFEMSKHGYPILGDVLYGGEPCPFAGIALRAKKIDFSSIKKREDFALPLEMVTTGIKIFS